jgi:hypothetical protein
MSIWSIGLFGLFSHPIGFTDRTDQTDGTDKTDGLKRSMFESSKLNGLETSNAELRTSNFEPRTFPSDTHGLLHMREFARPAGRARLAEKSGKA